jgi:hypothetical protein
MAFECQLDDSFDSTTFGSGISNGSLAIGS